MLNSMVSVCGKAVNSVWDARLKAVDVYPHSVGFTMNHDLQAVYNHNLMPVLTSRFPHFYPQVILAKTTLLARLFSPLSTLPITIATNLKNQER